MVQRRKSQGVACWLRSNGCVTHRKLSKMRKKIAKDMNNAMKKKKRLQSKACQLTDADLVEVLHMRKAKVSEAASSSGSPQQG